MAVDVQQATALDVGDGFVGACGDDRDRGQHHLAIDSM
jgi:hypothetical protein